MTGTQLGQYRLGAMLGQGGMGTVYRAIDEMLDREVAIKLLRADVLQDADSQLRFRTEAMTLSRLDHPHIARLIGFSRHEDLLYMVMAFVRGDTLQSRMKTGGPPAMAQGLAWTEQILDALHYAHQMGVVHRDIKPANILLDEQEQIRLTDFGIARVIGDDRMTRTGHTIGTAAYMSPEQVMALDVDGRADLYSVAIVLFEMLTGRVPYQSTTAFGLMREIADGAVTSQLSMLSGEARLCEPLLRRALARAPGDRFADAREMQRAVAAIAAARGTANAQTLAPTILPVVAAAAPGQIARRTSALAAGGVALALLGGAGWWAAASWMSSNETVTARAEVEAPVPSVASPVVAKADTPEPPIASPVVPQSPRAVARNDAPQEESAPPPAVAATPRAGRTTGAQDTSDADDPEPDTRSLPAASSAPILEFSKVRMMRRVVDEDEVEMEEVDVLLRLDGRRLIVVDQETRVAMRSVSYGSIAAATYAPSSPRRIPLPFARGPRHWLTLEVGRDDLVLRLDRNNYEQILTAIEQRAQVSVQRTR